MLIVIGGGCLFWNADTALKVDAVWLNPTSVYKDIIC